MCWNFYFGDHVLCCGILMERPDLDIEAFPIFYSLKTIRNFYSPFLKNLWKHGVPSEHLETFWRNLEFRPPKWGLFYDFQASRHLPNEKKCTNGPSPVHRTLTGFFGPYRDWTNFEEWRFCKNFFEAIWGTVPLFQMSIVESFPVGSPDSGGFWVCFSVVDDSIRDFLSQKCTFFNLDWF